MFLLNQETHKLFKKQWLQIYVEDPLIVLEIWNSFTNRKRYITDYNRERGIFHGYVVEDNLVERRVISFKELEGFNDSWDWWLFMTGDFLPCRSSELDLKDSIEE